MDEAATSGVTNRRPIGRRKKVLLLTSALVAAIATTLAGLAPPQAATAAIAGTTPILDVPQAALTTASPSCSLGAYCATYSVRLNDAQVFQAQINNPTARVEMDLYDEFGTFVVGTVVSAQDSDWITASVQSDGSSGIGVTPVTRPGLYTLVVGSDSQLYFSLYAFTYPNTLKVVKTNSVTRGEFNDRTTRRISGKYTATYRDGVVFNAKAKAKISISFNKPAESDAGVYLYDSFGNQVASGSGGSKASISDFVIPYSGKYQIYITGEKQGKFSLKVSQYIKVKKVSLGKKKTRTLKLNKKSKKTIKLKATVTPKNASNKALTWTSSNTKVARVSKNGKVKAVRPGRAKITVTTQDGSKRAKVTIVVKKK